MVEEGNSNVYGDTSLPTTFKQTDTLTHARTHTRTNAPSYDSSRSRSETGSTAKREIMAMKRSSSSFVQPQKLWMYVGM